MIFYGQTTPYYFSNSQAASSSSSPSGSSAVQNEILSNATGTVFTLAANFKAPYTVNVSNDGGVTYTTLTSGQYTISGQTLTLAASVTNAYIKFTYTPA